MRTKIYLNNEKFISGVTLKDISENENNNMALHTCKKTEDIIENRIKLVSKLGYKLNNLVCANQTHSENFYKVTKEDKGRGAESLETAIQNTDAIYTFESDILLSTFTADCVPVIFYSEIDGLIGVIHSGWQGTVKEIGLKLFNHLKLKENCIMKNLYVYLGLAISQEMFEVDEDVYLKFKNLGYADEFVCYNEHTNKYHIDNQKIVKKQCELVGIPSEQIFIDDTCTYKSPDGFSYREDKKSGRHLSYIMQKTTSE